MRRWYRHIVLAVGLSWTALPICGWAQSLNDVRGQKLTQEAIIQGLMPDEPPPPRVTAPRKGGKTRSLGIGQNVSPLRCTHYWEQVSGHGASRSLTLTPKMKGVVLNVTFATNSAELTAEARATLDTVGSALKSEVLRTCCFQIEGHTDDVGADGYNDRLSKRRADSVRQYLEQNYALKERAISVGFGEKKPMVENDNDENRQKNRRVQVINLGYGK